MPDHLGIDTTDALIAIICGSPERVAILASYFDRSVELTDKRGFLIYEAYSEKDKILFVAAGIGGPSTAIVIEELVDCGIKVIIRVGTCGALQPAIKVGDIVISAGAVRDEGTSKQYIDPAFPAIPDTDLLHLLITGARESGIPVHVGVTHCKDAYYLEKPAKQVSPADAGRQWNIWRNANVLATEMEAAVLFVLGSIRNIQTAALFISVGKQPDPHVVAVENIVNILKQVIPQISQTLLTGGKKSQAPAEISFLDKNYNQTE